jgi:hypothetical protein
MKPATFLLFSLFIGAANMSQQDIANAQSKTVRNGFRFSEPLMYIKDAFVVEDSERSIIGMINDASTSIAFFAKEVNTLQYKPSLDTLEHVLPEARKILRLPPELKGGARGRYVNSHFYCWKRIDDEHLQVRIEWADIASPDRYIDSYVFKKIGQEWYFERHGDMKPIHWQAVDTNFKRPC